MNPISQAFHEGGWGMWPTMLFGTLALALSLRHAIAPKQELLPLIVGVAGATLFGGALGFTTGIINTVKYLGELPAEREPIVFLYGLGESMNNLALALLLVTMVSLAAGVGSFRARLALAKA